MRRGELRNALIERCDTSARHLPSPSSIFGRVERQQLAYLGKSEASSLRCFDKPQPFKIVVRMAASPALRPNPIPRSGSVIRPRG